MSDVLNKVNLMDIAYPCATYALRRVGSNWSVERLLNYMPEPYSELSVGDIVVWDNLDSPDESSAYIMDEHGRPIWRSVTYKKHMAVYEGDGVVSDVKLIGKLGIPNIRMKRLSEMPKKPTGIIPVRALC